MKYIKALQIGICDKYSKIIRKEYYKWYNMSDWYLLQCICNRGFFKEKKCQHCGITNNDGEHAVNECGYYNQLGKEATTKLIENGMNKNLTLMEMINKIYVEPESDKQKRKKTR